MTRLNEIKNYFINTYNLNEEELDSFINGSVNLSILISQYAHRNEHRVNGEEYYMHPAGCLNLCRRFFGITDLNDPFSINKDLMYERGIPFDGAQELCLLHDVVEDTDFTINDICEIFTEMNEELYFNLYLKRPLELITHDKTVDYDEYIDLVMKNPISSLVKMIDMQDNLNALTLDSFGEENYNRSSRYLSYIYKINNKYHFIENMNEYRNKFRGECNE